MNVLWYHWTVGDARVDGCPCAVEGRNAMSGEAGHHTEGREGGLGTISKLRNNNPRSLGPE